MDNFYRVSR